jgi:hypothetical protein
MKARTTMAAMVTALALGAWLSAFAGDDERDWQKAQFSGEVKALDLYLYEHPEGAHASDALSQAVQQSASGLAGAAASCNPSFPVMAYYACASPAGPRMAEGSVAGAMSAAVNCSFSPRLLPLEKARAVEGLIAVRTWLSPGAASGGLTRGLLDLGLIQVDLEYYMLIDMSDEIYKCKVGDNPFTDPSKKEVYDCSRPHRERQAVAARAMADQVKSDFALVAGISDREYRMNFWEKYRQQAKKELVQEVAAHYQLAGEAERARAQESDPNIQAKIEQVAILLAGGGKPTGAGF